MKNAFKTSLSLLFFGFKLPYVVWLKSKNKLSSYNYNRHEDILDDEYIVLGDNRVSALDSRKFGSVKRSTFRGHVRI